ncbi:NAD(P)/FAD-dependent oxidoreductase [Glycomyces niveus]|uniref:FAD-dependent oxidoreductase n=1 Tax=Glycomyces niveus TaxID=2820287 RepID=A0ABS3U866_9ACTN|nr:FAD-dependent oxidoreductase [Glycomyces sp. NEAU-S30]MBO3734964.1 FAD-dependent oxidoreductase [Glycomyces sp. NEAU-S30]
MTQQGKTVAIIGGGYGGAALAKALDEHTDVVLIEPKDAFVHAAGSLRAVTQPDEFAARIFYPYEGFIKRGKQIREYAAGVDERGVTLASGTRVDADYIVVATGSGYPYPAKTRTDSTDEALAHFKATHAELAGAGRVLIAGAGPVGLELAGEIKAVWPEKQITIVDPSDELMPGYEAELRTELHAQLEKLGIEVRLGTSLDDEPAVEPGRAGAVSVTAEGERIEADIWFQAFGASTNSGYLENGIAPLNRRGQLPVTPKLNVEGHAHVYAIGDVTDVNEEKRAASAGRHAEVVAANIIAQINGEAPKQEYEPSPVRVAIVPLGPGLGVGQIPTENGPAVLPLESVIEWKGRDLMTGYFDAAFRLEPAA